MGPFEGRTHAWLRAQSVSRGPLAVHSISLRAKACCGFCHDHVPYHLLHSQHQHHINITPHWHGRTAVIAWGLRKRDIKKLHKQLKRCLAPETSQYRMPPTPAPSLPPRRTTARPLPAGLILAITAAAGGGNRVCAFAPMAPIDWPIGVVGAGARPDSCSTNPADSWDWWPPLTAVALADRGGRGFAGALTAAAGSRQREYGMRRRERGGARRGKVCGIRWVLP